VAKSLLKSEMYAKYVFKTVSGDLKRAKMREKTSQKADNQA
jgi:hypothetical protein